VKAKAYRKMWHSDDIYEICDLDLEFSETFVTEEDHNKQVKALESDLQQARQELKEKDKANRELVGALEWIASGKVGITTGGEITRKAMSKYAAEVLAKHKESK
jgi:hypothetical protein